MDIDEHKLYHRRLLYVVVVMILLLFGGATFYTYIENLRFLDALYFSAATMTTVGYGDISPKTDIGKIATIFYLFFSVGIALYGLSILASHFVEVREEFWFERFGKIKLPKKHENLSQKIKNIFSFKADKLVKENNSKKR